MKGDSDEVDTMLACFAAGCSKSSLSANLRVGMSIYASLFPHWLQKVAPGMFSAWHSEQVLLWGFSEVE